MLFLKNSFHFKTSNFIFILMLIFSILVILPPPVLASNYSINVSKNSDRSNTIPLESSNLAGLLYIQVMDDTNIDQVNFYLDSNTGTPYQTENIAPYDMSGTNNDGSARSLNTMELVDGSHYIHASIVLKDGSIVESTAYFNIINSSFLVISQNPDRSNSVPLESNFLTDLAYIQVLDDTNIDQVNFYLDSSTGTPYQTENIAPYDLSGTNDDGSARPLNTTELLDGSHYIFASIVLSDGSEITDTAYFNVNNPPPSNDYVLLDVHINGQGVIKELNSGLECRESNCSFKFEAGTLVHLNATPTNKTDEFSAWEGICEGKNDCIFSIDYDNTVTALFNEQVQDTQSKSSPSFSLVFNNNSDRGNPLLLQTDNLSGLVYIELLSSIQIKDVAFFLDSSPDSTSNARQIERLAPYDFSGTNSSNAPNPFDTETVSDGGHTIFALITLEDGTKVTTSSDFYILNINSDTSDSISDTSNSISDTSNSISDTSNSISDTSNSISDTSNSISDTSNSISDTSDSNSDTSDSNSDTLDSISDTSDSNNYSSYTGQTTISWSAPTERENGMDLLQSEITKYVIYYGSQSRVYTDSIEVTEKINNALPISVLVDHLEPGLVYYFSGITVDSSGLRSKMSNEVSKEIPR